MGGIKDCCEGHTSRGFNRRALLLGGATFAAWAYLPKFARAKDGRDPRLITIILRGALDGLATVAPVGDPDYARLHCRTSRGTRPRRNSSRKSLPRTLSPTIRRRLWSRGWKVCSRRMTAI